MRYDSASRRSFLLTFKTVAIGCSLFPGGFLFQNHYPRFRGAPSGFLKGCPQGPPSVDTGLDTGSQSNLWEDMDLTSFYAVVLVNSYFRRSVKYIMGSF